MKCTQHLFTTEIDIMTENVQYNKITTKRKYILLTNNHIPYSSKSQDPWSEDPGSNPGAGENLFSLKLTRQKVILKTIFSIKV